MRFLLVLRHSRFPIFSLDSTLWSSTFSTLEPNPLSWESTRDEAVLRSLCELRGTRIALVCVCMCMQCMCVCAYLSKEACEGNKGARSCHIIFRVKSGEFFKRQLLLLTTTQHNTTRQDLREATREMGQQQKIGGPRRETGTREKRCERRYERKHRGTRQDKTRQDTRGETRREKG